MFMSALAVAVGGLWDARKQDVSEQAPMDGFTAFP